MWPANRPMFFSKATVGDDDADFVTLRALRHGDQTQRAKDGRQHSSRIVRCTRSTAPLVAGRPARMNVWVAPSLRTVSPKTELRNSEPLSVRTRSRRQPWDARSDATRRARALVIRADGLSGVVASSAQT